MNDLLSGLQAQILNLPGLERRHLELNVDQVLLELVEFLSKRRILFVWRVDRESLYDLLAALFLLSTLASSTTDPLTFASSFARD